MNSIIQMLFYSLVLLLLGAGCFFTLRFGCLQLRALPHSLSMLKRQANREGVTPFQAFSIGLAARVGTGTIVGIAIALTVGGPGAIFWMWVTGFIGMSSAFVEATLAQIFKVPYGKNSFRGGPAYYIRAGLNSRFLSIAFALSLILTYGFAFNAVQAHSVSDAFSHMFGWDRAAIGIALVLLTAPVLFGGLRRVGYVSSVIVPIMALGYLALACYVVWQNLSVVPDIFKLIITNAFGFKQAAGGVAGYALSQVVMTGVRRGLFANEAGMGSAPNAAAAATTRHPATQGLLQMLGVAIDTFVICTATALMILVSGEYTIGTSIEGAALTQRALASAVGHWGNLFMTLAIFLFGWSTIIGNYAYAESNFEFLSRKPFTLQLFRVTVLGIVMIGSVESLEHVWAMADVSMAIMAIINLGAIIALSKYALVVWQDYQRQRRAGVKEPVFAAHTIPELANKLAHPVWKESETDSLTTYSSAGLPKTA
jgi:alanine or glycine:cation symporter, AGCS family